MKNNNINKERRLKDAAKDLDINDAERINSVKFRLQTLLNTIDLMGKNFQTRYDTIDLLFDIKLKNYKKVLKKRESDLMDKHFKVKLQEHDHEKELMKKKMDEKLRQLKKNDEKRNRELKVFNDKERTIESKIEKEHIKNMEKIYVDIKDQEKKSFEKNKELEKELGIEKKSFQIDEEKIKEIKKKEREYLHGDNSK